MAVRKIQKTKRAPARSRSKKTGASRPSGARRRERRRRSPETLRLRSVMPSFTVSDLERSLRFYTEVLGFIVGERFTGPNGALRGVMLTAGSCELGLSQDDWAKGRARQRGEAMRIYCKTAQNIDELATRIKAAGTRLTEEPTDQPWGARSLSLDDPDGFHLTFYRETRQGKR